MFETLTLTTLLLVLFFFYQNMRLGLTSAVPKDPDSRVRFLCSECLTTVKQLLAGSTVHKLESDCLTFVPAGQQSLTTLTAQDGKALLQPPGLPPKQIHSLGDQGQLRFEKLSGRGLMVTIEARDGEAAHKVAVCLEAQFLTEAAYPLPSVMALT